ncbi:MAG: alanine dehydrogenase [Flavobacteriales bacterium]|nr:alanine dehydrogenase [Flavobacteriales bacterium]
MNDFSELSPFSHRDLLPQEEMLEVERQKGKLFIGIPKETQYNERRICLTPDAVLVLTANGHNIVIESNAGLGANFSDKEYSEAGAKITYDTKEVFASNIVLKIAPPTIDEIKMMKPESFLISSLQFHTRKKEYFKTLSKSRITAIALDNLRDSDGAITVLTTLSEIAGTTSVHIAAELMSNVNAGHGLMLGGVTGVSPTEVVIIGAGVVGEYAARAAVGLGATVKIFDNSITRLRRVQDAIGQRVFTNTIHPKILTKALRRCDVLIGAIRSEGRTPTIVSEEMVELMKDGAVIIDVSIDSGGIVETSELTSHEDPTITKHGVIHYGVPNIPSRVSRTASLSISNYFTPYLLDIADRGGIESVLPHDKGLQTGIYMYHGVLTSTAVGEYFNIPFKDINLLVF